MNAQEIDSLATFLSLKLSQNQAILRQHIEEWGNPKLLTFEVTALYDKGLGPECMNIPNIQSLTSKEAQIKAETIATRIFSEKFGKKTMWDEIKIRPV
jgi:hypothetical protein